MPWAEWCRTPVAVGALSEAAGISPVPRPNVERVGATQAVASLDGPEESIALADMTSRTGLDVWDAQAATEALARIGAILTLDASRWEEPQRHIEEHLQVIEISDDM